MVTQHHTQCSTIDPAPPGTQPFLPASRRLAHNKNNNKSTHDQRTENARGSHAHQLGGRQGATGGSAKRGSISTSTMECYLGTNNAALNEDEEHPCNSHM